MDVSRKIRISGFLSLLMLLVSVYFFINRDRDGNYTRQVSYDELYAYTLQDTAVLKKWQHVADIFSEADKKQGKALTTAYADISPKDSGFEKLIKIASWLQRSLSKAPRGAPTAGFGQIHNILDKFKSASKGETPVWCGTFGGLFLFFCSANGILCRYIEPSTDDSRHIVNECYIPELEQWVFTDLMYDAVYCRSKDGKIMNTADIMLLNARKDTSSFIRFTQPATDSFNLQPVPVNASIWKLHLNEESKLNFYYTLDKDKVYTTKGKILKYLYPSTWYEVFALKKISNTRFYFRLFFLYGSLFLFVLFIYFILHDRSKKHKEKFR